MRGSREAPNWVWRARRGRWAKVPRRAVGGGAGMSAAFSRAHDGLAGRRVCGWIEVLVGTLHIITRHV